MQIDDKRNLAIASYHNWLFDEIEIAFHTIEWPQKIEERWDIGTLKEGVYRKAFKEQVESIEKKRKENTGIPNGDERMADLSNAIKKAAEKSIKFF